MCVLGYRFCLHPVNAGWDVSCVCWGAGFPYVLPLLAGVCGVCVPVRILAAPQQFWLDRRVSVLVGACKLYPANAGWRVGCVLLCAGATCTLPVLVAVFGAHFWVQALASARHSWLGCGVDVFVSGFCLYPASPRWGLWYMGLGARFTANRPILAAVYGFVGLAARSVGTPSFPTGVCSQSVQVRVQMWPAIPGWFLWCVRCGTGLSFSPPILAGVCGVCVPVLVLASPRPSWLGLVVCVLGYWFWFHSADPGWGVGYVCFGAGFALTPPILAWVWGFCLFVHVLFVPRQSLLGFVVRVFGCDFGFTLPILPGVCNIGFLVQVLPSTRQ